MQYCADTSAMVAAYVERYPPEFFPGFWDKFGLLIQDGKVFAPDEVRRELMKRSSEVVDWLDQFDGFWRVTDQETLNGVAEILGRFPKLVMERKFASAADPFLISVARIEGATVLTEEGFGSQGRPKIPLVCQHYKVSCGNLLDMIRREGWVMA